MSSSEPAMKPVTPGSTSSGMLPRPKATTGHPESIASMRVSPNGSFHSIGMSSARASRSSGTFCSVPMQPEAGHVRGLSRRSTVCWHTRGPGGGPRRPRGWARLRGPRASIAACGPFSRARRPMKHTYDPACSVQR